MGEISYSKETSKSLTRVQIPAGALLPWFKYVYAQVGNETLPWNRSRKLSQDSKSFLSDFEKST
jgi:hypothetical protein